MPIARSAVTRGMQLVAGMLSTVAALDAKAGQDENSSFQLVTWHSHARSRREDELARSSQLKETP